VAEFDKKPRIGILTSLTDFSPAYSLTGIIKDQARVLKEYGYEYDIIALKRFNPHDQADAAREGLEVRYVLSLELLPSIAPHDRPPK